ncbi:MAG: hypothetical protein KIC62_02010 [Clostridium sp.]|nr:hypothetical protein [Clostridium sp.]
MKCPVCSNDVEWFDICDKCNWQNGGPDRSDDYTGGNKMTLKEAREAYKNGEKII